MANAQRETDSRHFAANRARAGREPQAMWETEVSVQDKSLAGRRVLIIEDESTVATLFADIARELGCEIAGLASRFSEAIEKARSLSADVAILDIYLSGQASHPVAKILAERGIPVVVASGYGEAAVPASLPAAALLQKPFHVRDLERALRVALDPVAAAQPC